MMNEQLNLDRTRNESSAVFGDDSKYRYLLSRRWKLAPGFISSSTVLWIMLNPSTAGAIADDPTITRCIRFSKQWGFGGLEVVNLFGFRATDPSLLKILHTDGEDIVGPENDKYIVQALKRPNRLPVAAWGVAGKELVRHRAEEVVRLVKVQGLDLQCLGHTKDGSPVHPLRISYREPLRHIEDVRR